MMQPYTGFAAALATMHGKETEIGPPLMTQQGLNIIVPQEIDTGRFGTFAGDVPRAGAMRETTITKARTGIQVAGSRLGIASEGSFRSHPAISFIAAEREVIVLVDARDDLVIGGTAISERTNFEHLLARPGDDVDAFLTRIEFPEHAVIVKSNKVDFSVIKGITTMSALRQAITTLAGSSSDGLVRIETDMRAHLNSTRMREIESLAQRFANRLTTLCPACGSPEFGVIRAIRELPCSECRTPTERVSLLVSGCGACKFESASPRSDGQTYATPSECLECNP